MYTKADEVLAYAVNGEAYCVDCFKGDTEAEGVAPIFATEEWWNGLHCGQCRETIVEPTYVVGYNLSGLYLPDTEPYLVQGWTEAKASLLYALHEAKEAHYATLTDEEMTPQVVNSWRIIAAYIDALKQTGKRIAVDAPDGFTYWLDNAS